MLPEHKGDDSSSDQEHDFATADC